MWGTAETFTLSLLMYYGIRWSIMKCSYLFLAFNYLLEEVNVSRLNSRQERPTVLREELI
jgi:hypothetical protein